MRRALLPLAALVALLLAGCGNGGAASQPPLRLVLDFTPNAAHSGIYMAVANERDVDRGLKLEVRQPTASTDSLKLLAAGRAELAVADIHDLGLARERGEDLVGVGALVQRPLAAVIGRPPVRRPRDLEGRRVGVTGVPSDGAVLRAVVEHDGGDPKRVRRITIGFTAVPSLLARKVDAVTSFWSVEGVTLRRERLATREFRVDEYGAPPYPELVLVARRETVREQPERIRTALAAIADGTRDALADREAAAARVAKASEADIGLIRAELDAVAGALTPPVRLDRRALEGWAAFDERFGILRERPDVDEAFDLSLGPR